MVSQGEAIAALLLNVLVLPGIGTILWGNRTHGVWQLALFFGGIVCVIVGALLFVLLIGIPIFLLGFLMLAAAWIWGLVSGIQLVSAHSTRK